MVTTRSGKNTQDPAAEAPEKNLQQDIKLLCRTTSAAVTVPQAIDEGVLNGQKSGACIEDIHIEQVSGSKKRDDNCYYY